MATESTERAWIVGTLMLALSILGASYFVSRAINRAADGLNRVAVGFEAMEEARGPGGDRAARQPVAGPDPTRRYDVEAGASPVRGGEKAVVTIVEWSDFQCPFCARVGPTLARIQSEYGDRVKLIFKHLPLPIHPGAPAAHAAAEAAHRQGRFWEMHDRIFAAPQQLDPLQFVAYAEEIGLDVDRFKKDVASPEVSGRIDADAAQASKLGVTGTPAFFINGRFLDGAQPFESFKRVIDEELRLNSSGTPSGSPTPGGSAR